MVQVCRWLLIEETRVQSQNNTQEMYGLQSDGEKGLIKKFGPYRMHVNTTNPVNRDI
jgi:hypothetical protein